MPSPAWKNNAYTSDTPVYSLSITTPHPTSSTLFPYTTLFRSNDAGAVDALAAGETLSDTFTVKVADNHGGFASQDVKITITGTNDAPAITSAEIGRAHV